MSSLSPGSTGAGRGRRVRPHPAAAHAASGLESAARHRPSSTQRPEARTRTRAFRRIGADPTSSALLLAGPTAMELWPGVRRVGDSGGRVLVEAVLSDATPSSAAVRALPPRRTPTAFVTRFEWAGPGLPLTAGELTLGYAPGADGGPATSAVLELVSTGVAESRLTPRDLQAMADAFLANLAVAAEARSTAA